MKKKPQAPQKKSSFASSKKPLDNKKGQAPHHAKKRDEGKKTEFAQKPVKKSAGVGLPEGVKKYRSDDYIYGQHAVMAVLNNPRRECRLIAVTADKVTPELEALSDEKDCRLTIIANEGLNAILPAGAVHQGMALIADNLSEPTEEEILSGQYKRIMILDGVTDPHNVGAIMRSCAAFGCYVLIMQDRHAPSLTGVVSKSAASATECVSVVRVNNLTRIMEKLKQSGYYIYGADGQADVSLDKVKFAEKSVIVMGSEGEGMRRLVRENCDVLLSIPMSGKMESLNVSVASGVILAQSFFSII